MPAACQGKVLTDGKEQAIVPTLPTSGDGEGVEGQPDCSVWAPLKLGQGWRQPRWASWERFSGGGGEVERGCVELRQLWV